MMQGASSRRRAGLVGLLAGIALCAPATRGVAADDAGIGAFFRDQLGIGAEPQAAAPNYDLPEDRPIIVRPRRTHSVARRPEVKIAVGPVAPVSIYEDKTLKRGDAVMTKTGVRVFLGGHGAPYTEADFAALSDTDGLPKQVEKALVVINKAPRG